MSKQITLEDFAWKTFSEGTGYALAHYWGKDTFRAVAKLDPELGEACEQVGELLSYIQSRLETILEEAGIEMP